MKNYIISSKQFFALVILFELGSAIVVGLGMKAKQDAWLAILIGLIGGIILFILYFYLYFKNSKVMLTEVTRILLGKYLGGFIALLYVLYFDYIAARVLRDFGELVMVTALEGTPLIVINIIIMIVITYACYLGIEAIGRTVEILAIILCIAGILLFILVFAAGLPNFNNLLPVLENGWKPVLTTAFPLTLTFPFGEAIVFTMIFPNVDSAKLAMKYGFFAILISGCVLSAVIAINISVLGVTIASISNFPLLETLKSIRIGELITRLDSIAILILIIGGFTKITVFTYVSIIGFADIFKVKNHRVFIIPVCVVIIISSLLIASSFTQHIKIGLEILPKYTHVPLYVIVPIFLGIVTYVKHRKKGFKK